MPCLYICSECYNPNRGEGIFANESNIGQIVECPNCGHETCEFQRNYIRRVGQVKEAVNFDVAAEKSSRAKRPNRGTTQHYGDYDMSRGRADETEVIEIPDSEFVPALSFNPAMRYTKAGEGNAEHRDVHTLATTIDASFRKEIGFKVTGKHGRATPSVIMASYVKLQNSKYLSAFDWANWGINPANRGLPYKISAHNSLEWCHLWADSLGGATEANNLVAASYAANTYMMTIEKTLSGRTELYIQVLAHCSKEHVAEIVEYVIYKSTTEFLPFLIDARNNKFTQVDYEGISLQLAKFIGKAN